MANKDFPKQTQSQRGKGTQMKLEPEIIKKSYKGSDKLKVKVALITGGDSGICRSGVVHFAKEGANKALIYLNEKKDATDTKKMVEKEG